MKPKKDNFRTRVYGLVREIPRGRVMTYGDIAAICGSANASRIVGQIAHFGPADLPWQRVVNRHGGLARAYSFGGRENHKHDLEKDGVIVDDNFTVQNFEQVRWKPKIKP